MTARTGKTATDHYWNDRAQTVADHRAVNINDLPQRRLENEFIFAALRPSDRLLEVGCGNGFLTDDLRQRAAFVDAFDFAENMVASAKQRFGERNNRFFVDSVLSPRHLAPPYDAVVCVRVLINLSGLEEQRVALSNMAHCLGRGGRLVLVEGFLDGFERLNELRARCGLDAIKPAAINFYSRLMDLEPTIASHFRVEAEWHSGMFDVLTRVVYPLLVGPQAATGPSEFHEKVLPLASALNPAELKPFARVRGILLRRND